tara:strand:+ start:316 stop:585 length:270 start_codon:yes stop_codon:yes gene_type:complete
MRNRTPNLASSLQDPGYRKIIARLRAARDEKGITQAELAEMLKKPQSFVAKVEGYERRLDVYEFCLMARAIGVDAGEVIEGEPYRKPKR